MGCLQDQQLILVYNSCFLILISASFSSWSSLLVFLAISLFDLGSLRSLGMRECFQRVLYFPLPPEAITHLATLNTLNLAHYLRFCLLAANSGEAGLSASFQGFFFSPALLSSRQHYFVPPGWGAGLFPWNSSLGWFLGGFFPKALYSCKNWSSDMPLWG